MLLLKKIVIAALSGLFASTQAVAVPRVTPSESNSNNGQKCRQTKVAVLGAGTAGITTAYALSNASMTDFVIIDRNDYIGGRVHHTTFGKQPDGSPYTIELGANWVQGLGAKDAPENPIWRLARKYHLENTYSNYSSILTYDQTGANDYSNLLDTWSDQYGIAAENAGGILTNNLQDINTRAGLSLAGWKLERTCTLRPLSGGAGTGRRRGLRS